MSSEITQWIAQIKELRQQLADTISDREAAHESAANWRQLYTNEAQQRRLDSRLAQQQIEALKAEIRQLQGDTSHLKGDDAEAASAIEQQVAQLQTVEELSAKLKAVLVERDRLTEALKTEQADHAQTRKSLTAVIGDTVDQLTKEREMHQLRPESGELTSSWR